MSEFGTGLIYPIGLFLKHAERFYHADKLIKIYPGGENSFWCMWWYGAADHLMDLQIPDSLPDAIKVPAYELQRLAFAYRLPLKEKSDCKDMAYKAIDLCTGILLEVDKLLGVTCEKGDWE